MLTIAHRGASGYKPENTLSSFQKACELASDMIELDVRMCKTGEPIVIHDTSLKRTIHKRGKVKHLPITKLKTLPPHPELMIPTLEEVLKFLDGDIHINIHIKEWRAITPTIMLLRKYLATKKWSYEQIIISSHHLKTLYAVKRLDPKLQVSFIIRFLPRLFMRLAKRLDAVSVQLHKKITTHTIVSLAHQLNLSVFSWTVNSPSDIQKITKLHVDGIITDYPDRVKQSRRLHQGETNRKG